MDQFTERMREELAAENPNQTRCLDDDEVLDILIEMNKSPSQGDSSASSGWDDYSLIPQGRRHGDRSGLSTQTDEAALPGKSPLAPHPRYAEVTEADFDDSSKPATSQISAPTEFKNKVAMTRQRAAQTPSGGAPATAGVDGTGQEDESTDMSNQLALRLAQLDMERHATERLRAELIEQKADLQEARRELASDKKRWAADQNRGGRENRQPYEGYASRPKPITDFKGIELGMTVSAYRAAKAVLSSSVEHNLNRCGWSERDCVTHITRCLPLSFTTSAVSMADTDDLFDYLDQQFLTETNDQEEEDWEELRIGVKSIAEFANELQAMATRLGKDAGQAARCFVRALKEDYPELYRHLRIDHDNSRLPQLVRQAKKWIEISRGSDADPAGPRGRTPRVAMAARPGYDNATNDAALLADLTAQVRKLEAQMNNVQMRGETLRNPITKLSDAEIEQLPWMDGTVNHVNPAKAYANLMPAGSTDDRDRVHCLTGSAPTAFRSELRVGEPIRYKAIKDDKGWRVVTMHRPHSSA